MESQSYFLDETKLVALTAHSHMLVMLECLLAKQNMTIGSTEWQDTDGCGKQYRRGIGRPIGSRGHGKDIDDRLKMLLI
jgi:hypothetical protein